MMDSESYTSATESQKKFTAGVARSAFLGSLPLTRGAHGPKPDGIIGIGINPVSLSSRDTAPFGPGLPPPTSDTQRAEYAAMQAHINTTFFTTPQTVFNSIMSSLGATLLPTDEFTFSAPYLWPDRFLQMCPPSIMYPRSDAPSTFRFAGGLPKLPPKLHDPSDTSSPLPPWWNNEILTTNRPKDNMKLVFVCQGTVILDYTALVIPTIEALKSRPNTLVIAVLGLKGAALPADLADLPDNVRVVDYLPYDAILPVVDVFVGNGGYGGVIHSLSHGTPMVLAGDSEDKAEMCAITAWAGAAVNLKTGRPSVEAVRGGVEEVLSERRYKEVCGRIKSEMEGFDPVGVIGENIDELVKAAGF